MTFYSVEPKNSRILWTVVNGFYVDLFLQRKPSVVGFDIKPLKNPLGPLGAKHLLNLQTGKKNTPLVYKGKLISCLFIYLFLYIDLCFFFVFFFYIQVLL